MFPLPLLLCARFMPLTSTPSPVDNVMGDEGEPPLELLLFASAVAVAVVAEEEGWGLDEPKKLSLRRSVRATSGGGDKGAGFRLEASADRDEALPPPLLSLDRALDEGDG